jgi:hypothetical protein
MSIVKYTFKCEKNCCGLPCRMSVVENEGYLFTHVKEIENRIGKLCILNDKETMSDWKFERKDNISRR